MSIYARRELLASVSARYAGAPRAEKTRILDEFAAATGYHLGVRHRPLEHRFAPQTR